MPISELVRIAQTLDDAGSSPLALDLGQPWDCDQVRFVRSSANHVFFSDRGVIRFRPVESAVLEHVRSVADLATRVVAAGGPLAPACPTRDGSLAVESRAYVASMLVRVEGTVVDAESVSRAQARAWGRGLARLHDVATHLDPPPLLPRWSEQVPAGPVAAELARLPIDDASFGVVHGDPELDNVVWTDGGAPVFVDLDDAAWSWFAADIAFALRDFAPLARAPDTALEPVASFLAGYREVRDVELDRLRLFAHAHALVTLARLRRTLDEPVDPEWPEWAATLRRRVEGVAARLQAAVEA